MKKLGILPLFCYILFQLLKEQFIGLHLAVLYFSLDFIHTFKTICNKKWPWAVSILIYIHTHIYMYVFVYVCVRPATMMTKLDLTCVYLQAGHAWRKHSFKLIDILHQRPLQFIVSL
jgi:hypothetical protein